MRRIKWANAIMVMACLVFATQTMATDYHWEFPIDGTQSGTGATGTGFGIVDYDDTSMLLEWEISYEGLTGPITLAHFHGPAPAGINAGVQVFIGNAPFDNPIFGSEVIDETQEEQLLGGLWYANLHTEQFGGGEIRGQVVPEPAALAILSLGGLLLLRRHRAKH